MPSSWHESQEGIHQGQEALFHVFSPVPGALSCDQDKTLSLDTGADLSAQPHWVWQLPEGTASTMKV